MTTKGMQPVKPPFATVQSPFSQAFNNGEHGVNPVAYAPPPTIATATHGHRGSQVATTYVANTDYKDRHTVKSSNNPASTINAPVKKGGDGGYSWGGVMDVTDYQPVGIGGYTAVQTVASPTVQTVSYATPFTASVTSSTQFPSLGTAPVAAAAPAAWGQVPPSVFAAAAAPVTQTGTAYTTASAPSPQFIDNQVRAGVTCDAQHPRNMFATKPYKPPAQQQPAQLAIDWSGAGSTGFTTQLINTVVNPAHLGPYTQPKPGPPMSQIMARPDPVNYIPNKNVQPKNYQSPQLGRTQGIIQQPRQKR